MVPTPQPSLFLLNPIIFVEFYPKKAKFPISPRIVIWWGMLNIHFNVKYVPVLIGPLLPFPTQTRLIQAGEITACENCSCRVSIHPQPGKSAVQYQHQRRWQVPLLPRGEKDERSEPGRQGIRACSACGHLLVKF